MNNINLVFLRNHGIYGKGDIANFPETVADTIIKSGAAKVLNPEIPKERKTSSSKTVKK